MTPAEVGVIALGRYAAGMQRTLWLGLAVAWGITGALGGGCTREISDKDIRAITLEEVRKMVSSPKENEVMLVDPRPPSDFAAEHIAGARNISLNQVTARSGVGMNPELEAYRNLIVYGNDPGSAIAVAMTKRLMEAGHDRVWLFRGGLIEWRRAGLKTEKGGVEAPPSN
jgi:rhodanese-related sulfurtransferase